MSVYGTITHQTHFKGFLGSVDTKQFAISVDQAPIRLSVLLGPTSLNSHIQPAAASTSCVTLKLITRNGWYLNIEQIVHHLRLSAST